MHPTERTLHLNEKKICVALLLICTLTSSCKSHIRQFAQPDCVSPQACIECGDTFSNPLGHTTDIGVCKRCGEIQNPELFKRLKYDVSEIMKKGNILFEHISKINPNDEESACDLFRECDNVAAEMTLLYNDILTECSKEETLARITFQTKLLLQSVPSNVDDSESLSLIDYSILYQLYLRQISSAFNYYAEDIEYMEGKGERPAPISFYPEAPTMPTPDSVIYDIIYDSEKTESGVKQYIYMLDEDLDYATAQYNIFLRALELNEELEVMIEKEYAFVFRNGKLLSAMKAGTDNDKGNFLVVSFG